MSFFQLVHREMHASVRKLVFMSIIGGVSNAAILTAINTGAGSKGKDFILEKAGTGVFDVGQGSHAGSLFGIVYAPSTDITVDGGQMYVDGSLTLNSFRVNGNPNFELRYDDTIQTILATNWEVRNWREIPSAQY